MRMFSAFAAALALSTAATVASSAEPKQAEATQAEPSQAAAAQPLRVLIIGNSLTYTNNLPRLLQALAKAQPGGPRIDTTTYVEAGGSLDERWSDGSAAGSLRDGHWDALVLQESSGLPHCLANPEKRRQPSCRDSERAHKRFSELAKASGARVLLLTTWGPSPSYQPGINQGYDMLASMLGNAGFDAEIVPTAQALGRYATQQTWKSTLPDGLHPSLAASLIMAAQLYRAITGREAQAHDLTIDFRMLPVNPALKPGTALETQVHLAGADKNYLLTASALAPLLQVAYAPE